jgi:hypothetical protein
MLALPLEGGGLRVFPNLSPPFFWGGLRGGNCDSAPLTMGRFLAKLDCGPVEAKFLELGSCRSHSVFLRIAREKIVGAFTNRGSEKLIPAETAMPHDGIKRFGAHVSVERLNRQTTHDK